MRILVIGGTEWELAHPPETPPPALDYAGVDAVLAAWEHGPTGA